MSVINSNQLEATRLIKEAQKLETKLQSKFHGLLGNHKQIADDVIEIYLKAVAHLKMGKKWNEAGDIYRKCAELYLTYLKDTLESAIMWENAAKAFKSIDSKQAVACYLSAVEIQMENNRFNVAAKIWKEIAIIHEKQHQLKEAQTSYQRSADCYEAESSTLSANAMLLKVAEIMVTCEHPDYVNAIKIYEKITASAIENSAMKWSVKSYLFKALLCSFAQQAQMNDLDPITHQLNRYVEMCPDLEGSREHTLIEILITDFNEDETENFSSHIEEFDQISPLDPWMITALLSIKTSLENGSNLDGEVGV
jgi:alpha-soluble NSF attachment protein